MNHEQKKRYRAKPNSFFVISHFENAFCPLSLIPDERTSGDAGKSTKAKSTDNVKGEDSSVYFRLLARKEGKVTLLSER